jgi:hypothetical protein
MTKNIVRSLVFASLAPVAMTACQDTWLVNQLKAASAGHTGCAPEQMTISNVRVVGGDRLWNATCNGKTYLCSQVFSVNSSANYSCALAQ